MSSKAKLQRKIKYWSLLANDWVIIGSKHKFNPTRVMSPSPSSTVLEYHSNRITTHSSMVDETEWKSKYNNTTTIAKTYLFRSYYDICADICNTYDCVWAGLRVMLQTRYFRFIVPQWVISTLRPFKFKTFNDKSIQETIQGNDLANM